jgi:hypothetical protein
MQVKNLESMRRSLPEGCAMMVTMNRLLQVAVDHLPEEDRPKWEGLRGQKGMNAYVFVQEDGIRDSVKAYSSLLKSLKVRAPQPARFQMIVAQGRNGAGGNMRDPSVLPASVDLCCAESMSHACRSCSLSPRKVRLCHHHRRRLGLSSWMGRSLTPPSGSLSRRCPPSWSSSPKLLLESKPTPPSLQRLSRRYLQRLRTPFGPCRS